MPQNLELKARLLDPDRAEAIALAIGAQPAGTLEQTDVYFNVPAGRLKMRYETGQVPLLISYRRPDTDDSRTSDFLLVPVPEGTALEEALTQVLGVRVRVVKSRVLYLLESDVRIHLDRVEGLGAFFEYEVPCGGRSPGEVTALGERLREAFAPVLGEVVAGSYSDML